VHYSYQNSYIPVTIKQMDIRMLRYLFLYCVLLSFSLAQTTIAVIDFEARNISQGEAASLTDYFRSELGKTAKYTIVERRMVDEVIKEQGFQQTGCVSNECVVEVGQVLGVNQIIGGSIGKVGNLYTVSVRIIDVQSSEIVNDISYVHRGNIESLLTEGMRQVVIELISGATTPVVLQSQGVGTLYITSEPGGAKVWVDGVQIDGVTPITVENQKSGKHIITSRKGDYSAIKIVNLGPGDIAKLNLKLELGTGNLQVITKPFNAEILLDGSHKGTSPLVINNIKAGRHQLAVQLNGYYEYQKEVIVTGNSTENVRIELVFSRTSGGSEDDYGNFVQQIDDGGFIITGYTKSYGAGKYDIWLIKTDSNGNEEWNRTFGKSNSDYGYSVQQTDDSGFIITGSTLSNRANNADVWLIKTDSNGNEEWNRTYGGSEDDYGNFVQQTDDSGFIVTGYTESYGAGKTDVWLIKTDRNGNEEWNLTFGGSNSDGGRSARQTVDGGYIVTGYKNSYGVGDADVCLIKININGNIEY